MNQDDDDDLGIDLDAWQAPEPPSGIADAVIARMQTTHVGAAPVEPARAPRRRWWVLGGGLAAATALAGTVIAVFVMTRAPASGQGAVVAEAARHVELGPTSVALDPQSEVTWRRVRHALSVEQRRGAATWRVGDDDKLTIDAALASIEASEANLRVEVQMNGETKQTIKTSVATSAVTAAAVALVTVIVYDGNVRVTERDGATKTVAPGVAYHIRASGPNVIEEQMTVGASPDIAALDAEIASKRAELDALKRSIEEQQARSVDPFAEACDEVSCVLDNYEGDCCAKWRQARPPQQDAVPDSLDRAAIQRAVSALKAKVHACNTSYSGKLSVTVQVAPDGRVSSATIDPADAQPAACIAGVFRAARFEKTRNGGRFKYPFIFTAPQPSCDADDALARGKEAFSAGVHGQALAHFQEADACKPDTNTKRLAFAAACKLKDLTEARRYWRLLPTTSQNQVLQLCVANGITHEDLAAAAATATLKVNVSPPAKVLIDGVEHGTTPLSVTLAPGRHKVTFVVGDSKHTFSVTTKAGETTTLTKDLR